MSKGKGPAVALLGAAALGGAFLFSSRASAKVVPSDDGGDDTPPPDPTLPRDHPTIGRPFVPGQANELANAKAACSTKPKKHPRGVSQKSSQKLDDWLANVAFWETYPAAPTKLEQGSTFTPAWLRLRNYVRDCLKTGGKDKETPKGIVPDTAETFPDRGAEIRNATLVVQTKPRTFAGVSPPYNRQPAGQPDDVWWTNVAYWQTYPKAPVKLDPKDPAQRKYVDAYRRILGLVRVEIAKGKQKKEHTTPPGGEPTTEDPSIARPSKDSLSGAAEMRNAAIAAAQQPHTFERNVAPYNAWKASNPKQALADWLANVAYWTTYPTAPIKLSATDPSHRPYVQAWVRIRQHIDKALARVRDSGKPEQGLSELGWKQWAAVMTLASGIRTDAALRDAYRKALAYLQSPNGSKVSSRDMGKALANGQRVTTSGLLAEAATRVPIGKLTELTHWRENPSRAFWTANGMF